MSHINDKRQLYDDVLIAAILQMTFSKAFHWMKTVELQLKFYKCQQYDVANAFKQ